MKCPACQYKPTKGEQLESPDRCPKCLRIYAKVVEYQRAKAARQKTFKAAAEAKRKEQMKEGRLYCPSCGAVGNGKRHVPGSTAVELLMWLCFFLPGLIYSAWRLSAAKKACHVCKSTELIPVDSPRARRELGRS